MEIKSFTENSHPRLPFVHFSLPGFLLTVRKRVKLPGVKFLIWNPGWESWRAGEKGNTGRLALPLIPREGPVRARAGGHRLQGGENNPSGWRIWCQTFPHPQGSSQVDVTASLGNILAAFSLLFFGPLLTRALGWKRGAVLAPITYPRLLMGRVLMEDLRMFFCNKGNPK